MSKALETLDYQGPEASSACLRQTFVIEGRRLPPYTFSATKPLLLMNFTVGQHHCSPTRLHVLVDGNQILVTRWLGWPMPTPRRPGCL